MTIEIDKITRTLQLEKAAMEMFVSLGDAEIAAYLTAHPNSMFVDKAFLDHLKKGALHKELHVPADKPIPAAKERKALHSDSPLERKRARFAETVKHWHHANEETSTVDRFDTSNAHGPANYHVKQAMKYHKAAQGGYISDSNHRRAAALHHQAAAHYLNAHASYAKGRHQAASDSYEAGAKVGKKAIDLSKKNGMIAK